MATFAFFPARAEQRRGDQLNFALAVGASAAAARVVAETLPGEPNTLIGWTSVDITRFARRLRRRPAGRRTGADSLAEPRPGRGSYLMGT